MTNKMQRYTLVFITLNDLHVSAVPPPIIRSSKLCTQHRVFLTAIVSELEITHDSSKKQKKLDRYPMLCIQF